MEESCSFQLTHKQGDPGWRKVKKIKLIELFQCSKACGLTDYGSGDCHGHVASLCQ